MFDLGLSLYSVKKELMRPAFLKLDEMGNFSLYRVLSQQELRSKFAGVVDFPQWDLHVGRRKDLIPILKRT